MKKIFKTFAVLAAVAALGFSFVSCKNNDDDNGSGSPSSGGGNGGGGNSTTAVTKESIAPKNFKVEQVEGQNKLKFTWEAGTVAASNYTLTNKTTNSGVFNWKSFYNGETSYTIDWCTDEGTVSSIAGIALDSGEYEFTLHASGWSEEARSTILTDPISAKVNFEAKLFAPTVPENIEAYQTHPITTESYFAYVNFDKINNNGNYWIWYVSTTNDINTAVIRNVTKTSVGRVRFSYEKNELPAKGTTVYVWIKSALKIINTEGNEADWSDLNKMERGEYSHIKADSDTYSAPTEPFTFVWNLDTGN